MYLDGQGQLAAEATPPQAGPAPQAPLQQLPLLRRLLKWIWLVLVSLRGGACAGQGLQLPCGGGSQGPSSPKSLLFWEPESPFSQLLLKVLFPAGQE